MTGAKGPKGREKTLNLYCPRCWESHKAVLTKPKPIIRLGGKSQITGNVNVKCGCGYEGPAKRA